MTKTNSLNKNKKEKAEITIVLPPRASSQMDLDLVRLTKKLTKVIFKGESQRNGLLGGEYGYGVDYENDIFMMHQFCWCEQEDKCLWCMMNDPKENKNHKKMKEALTKKFGQFYADRGGAPNFYHKPSGIGIVWYKWIGRDMELSRRVSPVEWKKIIKQCIESI